MKKIHLIFSFFLIVSLAMANLHFNSKCICLADENIDVDVESQNNMYGGQQNLTLVSQAPSEVTYTYRSYIQPHAGTEFLSASRAVYLPHKKLPWYEQLTYRNKELYTLEEVIRLAQKDGDIIQPEGFCMTIEENKDPVRLLPQKPGGNNDIKLWSVMLETPANGFLNEAIRRAISLSKRKTNTRRVFVEVELQLKPKNAGNVLPFGSGSSVISGTTAWAFAANPQTGESESRIHNIWQVTVYSYNNGPIPPFSTLSNNKAKTIKPANKKKNNPSLVFFDSSGLNPENPAIAYNIQWIEKRWKDIQKKGYKVEFIALAPPGHDLSQIERIAHKGMVTVGSSLYKKGYNEEELESTFRYRSQIVQNPKLIKDLAKKNKSGVIVIKITG